MLATAVVLIMCVPLAAALIDAMDARRGRRRRDPGLVATERRDLQSDMSATQHQGICVPIDDICRDRQRGR